MYFDALRLKNVYNIIKLYDDGNIMIFSNTIISSPFL